MQITKNVFQLTAIAAALLVSNIASAQDKETTFINPEWADSAIYIGAGIGQTRSNLVHRDVIADMQRPTGTVNSFSADDRDVGYKLFIGKHLNRYLAVEGTYHDLGEFSFNSGTVQGGVLNATYGYRGIALDLIGKLPLTERLSAYARAGMNYTMAKTNYTGNRLNAVAAPELEDTRLNPKVGLGLEFKFSEALAMRAEVERYRIEDSLRDKGDVDMFSMSLVYKLGRPVAQPVVYTPAPEPTPVVAAPVVVEPAPEPVPVSEKVTFAAEALFDFDKSVVKPNGQAALDELLGKLQGMDTEVMVAVGHTDSIGSDAYNDALSMRRADAVKAYIVSKGVDAARVYTEGKGESQPVADNGTNEGRAQNRRVTVEVVGTRTVTK
jgi:OOP family OmpA-OmpF porin